MAASAVAGIGINPDHSGVMGQQSRRMYGTQYGPGPHIRGRANLMMSRGATSRSAAIHGQKILRRAVKKYGQDIVDRGAFSGLNEKVRMVTPRSSYGGGGGNNSTTTMGAVAAGGPKGAALFHHQMENIVNRGGHNSKHLSGLLR